MRLASKDDGRAITLRGPLRSHLGMPAQEFHPKGEGGRLTSDPNRAR